MSKHKPSGKNSNVLDGMICPECGNEDALQIEVVQYIMFYDDGSDPYQGGDLEYGDASTCNCPECDYTATVKDFTYGAYDE